MAALDTFGVAIEFPYRAARVVVPHTVRPAFKLAPDPCTTQLFLPDAASYRPRMSAHTKAKSLSRRVDIGALARGRSLTFGPP
jgi:hypothetical protein